MISFATASQLSVSDIKKVSEKEFIKIEFDGKEAWTQSHILSSDYLIASNQIFYGSDNGRVTVTFFVRSKISEKLKFGIETHSKRIRISQVKIGETISDSKTQEVERYIHATDFNASNSFQEIQLEIEFDPREIGLQEEFDLVLYDVYDKELQRLDPFLSGWNYRQKATLETTLLDSDVTNDHVILYYVDSSNSDFWDNVDSTGKDVRFTSSDGETELNYHFEDFNHTTQEMTAWVLVPDTFSSTADMETYIYYENGSATDDQNQSAVFPASYAQMRYAMDSNADSTGNYADLNAYNGASVVTANCKLGDCYNFDNNASTIGTTTAQYLNAPDELTGDYNSTGYTFSLWASQDTNIFYNNSQHNMPLAFEGTKISTHVGFIWDDLGGTGPEENNVITVRSKDAGLSWRTVSKETYSFSTWYHIIGTWNPDGNLSIFVNATNTQSTEMHSLYTSGPLKNSFGALGHNGHYALDGRVDEFKLYNRVLSNDEIKLLYLSENNDLIAFSEEETEILSVDFNYSLSPSYLNPSEGINYIDITLLDTSEAWENYTVDSWEWFVDSVSFASDQNTSYQVNAVGDYNFCLVASATNDTNPEDTITDSTCQTIRITSVPQNVTYSIQVNSYSSTDANVGFTATADDYNASWDWEWLINDTNVATTREMDYNFSSAGDQNVCVNATNDTNTTKQYCASLYVSKVLMKIPKDETTQNNITPFDLSTNQIPTQDYNAISADTNIFYATQSASANMKITVGDEEGDYYERKYNPTLTGNYQELQPYLVPTATATSIKLITQNKADYSPIGGVHIYIYKNIGESLELVEYVITDDKGEAFTSGIVNADYTYILYYDEEEIGEFAVTITGTEIYFSFIPTDYVSPETYYSQVIFTPRHSLITDFNTTTSFTQLIIYDGITLSKGYVWVKEIDINGDVSDANLFSGFFLSVASGYEYSFTATNISTWDANKAIQVYVTLLFSDGSTKTFTQKYWQTKDLQGETWEMLVSGITTSFGCEEGESCYPLMLIALFFSVVATAGFALTTNFSGLNESSIVFCFALGFFTIIGWFPIFLTGMVSIITVLLLISTRGEF